jgi:hypothetical protein
MAQDLFAQIFTDEAFLEQAGGGRPGVVIADVDNDSHSTELETDVMFNALRNAIVRSRAVDLYARGADGAGIVIAAQLTSTYLRGERGRRQSNFTLNITLTALDGRFIGAWDVSRAYSC